MTQEDEDWDGYIAWLEKQGEQKPNRVGTKEATGTLKEMLDNIDPIELEETRKEMLDVDAFDAELNSLLKKYEHLPKEEVSECLSFYEQKLKWSEETDDAWLNGIICKVESGCTLNGSEIKWLKSLKQKNL